MPELRVGSRARWTSQSAGYRKTKEGTVIALSDDGGPIPRLRLPVAVAGLGVNASRIRWWSHFGASTGCIVEVDTIDGKPLRVTKFYAPRREHLEVIG